MKRTLSLPQQYAFMHMAEGIVYSQVPAWYGSDNRALRLNLIRKPDLGPRPTIVWLTGGAWRDVSKNVHVPEMVYLVEAGFTVATVEYRSSQDAIFPAQIEDVKSAIRYLRANAARWSVDPDHIGVMGESAGGHLAALAGTTGAIRAFDVGENLSCSSSVQCVCDWYGPADFTCFGITGDAASPEKLLVGSCDMEKARAASPISYVTPDCPPFLIIHGTNDTLVPFSQSEALYDRLTSCGVESDLIAIEGARHGDPRFVSPAVRQLILDFFKKHLG